MILITIFGRVYFYNSKVYVELDKDMARKIISETKSFSYEVSFIQYLTDIMIELNGLQVKAAKNDTEEINRHIANIKSTILAMMDAEFDRIVVFTNFSN